MTTFKELRGTAIQAVSSDPSNPELGQIWYNSSSGTLKGYQLANVNAWASGGAIPTARVSIGGAGTQTAALAFGGSIPPGTKYDNTNFYNGTAWTNNPTGLNTARATMGGAGTQTAALAFGGATTVNTAATESFNGSSWTSVNSLNTVRSNIGNAGIQTAALGIGGYISGTGASAATESWNGTSWTTVNSLGTARYSGGSGGVQTSAIIFGGGRYPAPSTGATETWNGTSWTTVPATLNNAQYGIAKGIADSASSALAVGGYPAVSTTEVYNGTSWTTNPTGLGTARGFMGSAGTAASGLVFGGLAAGTEQTATEEWTGQQLQVKTITVS